MAEIPERYEEMYDLANIGSGFAIAHADVDRPHSLRRLIEELGSAEARISVLEQERGAEGTNWFPESFVIQLQDQLREVTERCNHFCKMALVPDGTESRKEIIALQAQLAAVTQERDRLNERIKNQGMRPKTRTVERIELSPAGHEMHVTDEVECDEE